MAKSSQKFYEKAYQYGKKNDSPRSIFRGVYLSLKKYETYREDVVFRLLPHGERFLDVGCGDGNLVFQALAKFKYVHGIDIARTRLKKAREFQQKLPADKRKRVKFIFADADKKFDFKNNYFDVVAMVATLEHFFDPIHVLKEATRIIKPGGKLIIQVPNLAFLPRRIAVLLGNLPITSDEETGWDGGHLHYFTVSSLRKLFKKYNFEVKEITCSGILAKVRSFWVSALGADIVIKGVKKD